MKKAANVDVNVMKDFVGKYVQVFPGDSATKFGTVVEVNGDGVVFKIDGVRSGQRVWRENDGKHIFYAYASGLIFCEVSKTRGMF